MPSKRKRPIQEVAISEFQAKCLSLLEEVSKTKSPPRVTWHGKAIADLVPTSTEAEERSWTRIDVGQYRNRSRYRLAGGRYGLMIRRIRRRSLQSCLPGRALRD
jgi:antitoxin (DNA-binding transcriptional repressor) of toxin-antitoxin stability system